MIFSRRTYRIARRRAISRLLAARDAHEYALRKYGRAHSVTIFTMVEHIIREWEASQIVNRGRREKGMWT